MIGIRKINKEDWKELASNAHLAVFNEVWTPEKERIDYALLTVDENDMLIQYATIRESDFETSYIQYGGSFPEYKGSIQAYQSFKAILDWLYERYKNVSFLTMNRNWPMLKFAIKEKFAVVGMRNFNGYIMLEHFKGKES